MEAQTYAAAVRSNPDVADRAKAALNDLLTRSATDLEFRRKLLADPRQALADYTGRDASSVQTEVAFVENRPGTVTIVLPDAVDAAAELSEAELEAVAGGSTLACVASGLWIIAELIEACK